MNRLMAVLAILFLNAMTVKAQKLADLKWSDWVAINDRNENKVLFSFGYAKYGPPNEVDEKRTGFKWYFRIKNDYKEDISGRFVYEYASTDGAEHANSYILHCMHGKSIASNELLFVTNAEKLLNLYFVEFSPCSQTSGLTSFTKKDTALFRLQDAMIAQQQLRIQNANTNSAGSTSPIGLKSSASLKTVDFSDKTVIYKGKNDEMVRSLLSKVKGWRTNSGLNVQDGIPPELPLNKSICQRDHYVYSAILYAWAAESYYRINEISKAEVASEKVSELINLVKQLCGGGPTYVDGNCKTASIFPCSEISNNSKASLTTTTAPSQNSIQSSGAVTGQDNANNADSKKEKELLYGLLPLMAFASQPDNTAFGVTAISGLVNQLDKMVDEDTVMGTGAKLFLKLANYNTMSQLREISGDNASYNNFLTNFPSLNSGNGPNAAFVLPLSVNKPLSQMSSSELRQQIEPLWNAVGSLLDAGNDEDGLTARGKTKIVERYEAMREENKKLKSTYGYDLQDLMSAIKNFDDELLDKVLSTGFPIDTKISFSQRNEADEQAVNYTYENWGSKLDPKPVHYAAKYGNVYALQKLISKGANLTEKGKFHNMYGLDFAGALADEFANPLFIALTFNRYEAAKLLCGKMREPFPSKSWKNIALDIARTWQNDEMVDLIKSYSK